MQYISYSMMICLPQVRPGGSGLDADGGETASRASMPIHPRLLLGRASRLPSPASWKENTFTPSLVGSFARLWRSLGLPPPSTPRPPPVRRQGSSRALHSRCGRWLYLVGGRQLNGARVHSYSLLVQGECESWAVWVKQFLTTSRKSWPPPVFLRK